MDRCIEVIDQLRTNWVLGEYKLNGGERGAGIFLENGEVGKIGFGWLQISGFHSSGIHLGQAYQRLGGAAQKLADFSAGMAAFIAMQSLSRVRQHEFIALLDGGATSAYFVGCHLGRDALGLGWRGLGL